MSNTKWSAEQIAIFNWFKTGRGNLVVRARAGTGKTTTIIEAVEHAPEKQILLAAFNKDIATELQKRVKNTRVEAKTLHSLGFKYVRRNWSSVRIDENGERGFDLARRALATEPNPAPDQIVTLVKKLHSLGREIRPFATARDLLDIAVAFECLPDEEFESRGWTPKVICQAAHRAMDLAMEKTDKIDFADMIYLPLANNWVRPWFDMVVVDEAQDMTVAQLALATGACRRGGRIAVVGDDRQAIYGFRGADSDSLDRLKEELNATELSLTTTYRCPRKVVSLASVLVPDYRAADTAPEGEIVRSDRDKMELQAAVGDFILSRTNAPLIKICMGLLKRGVRARIKGRDIGRGLTALIKKLRPESILDLQAKLGEWLKNESIRANKLPGDASKARIDLINDQYEVLCALMDGAAAVSDLEARLTDLFSDDAEKGAVMCSTVHRSKGLEANKVWLLEGTFRSGRLEEDNIKYVGITRAKATLVWVTGFEAKAA